MATMLRVPSQPGGSENDASADGERELHSGVDDARQGVRAEAIAQVEKMANEKAKPTKRTLPWQMNYCGALRGVTEQRTGKHYRYFGLVTRRYDPWDISGMDQAITELEEGLKPTEDGCVPRDGIVELVEVFDLRTKELVSMWRVPFELSESQEEEERPSRGHRDLYINPRDVPRAMKLVMKGYYGLRELVGEDVAAQYAGKLLDYAEELLPPDVSLGRLLPDGIITRFELARNPQKEPEPIVLTHSGRLDD